MVKGVVLALNLARNDQMEAEFIGCLLEGNLSIIRQYRGQEQHVLGRFRYRLLHGGAFITANEAVV
jgi:hypothetical protein